jgi:hypothetical protein
MDIINKLSDSLNDSICAGSYVDKQNFKVFLFNSSTLLLGAAVLGFFSSPALSLVTGGAGLLGRQVVEESKSKVFGFVRKTANWIAPNEFTPEPITIGNATLFYKFIGRTHYSYSEPKTGPKSVSIKVMGKPIYQTTSPEFS